MVLYPSDATPDVHDNDHSPTFGSDDEGRESESDTEDGPSIPVISYPLSVNSLQPEHLQGTTGVTRVSRLHQPIATKKSFTQESEEIQPRELVSSAEIKDSYFEVRLRHVEFATWGGAESPRPACLIVLETNFQPRVGRSRELRFSDASIDVEFRDASLLGTEHSPVDRDPTVTGPTILDFAPTLVEGPTSTGQQTTSFAVSVSPNSGGLVPGLNLPTPLLPSIAFNNTTTVPKTGATVTHGVLRGSPPHRVKWTISENELTKKGIPRRVKLAMIVGYTQGRSFAMKVGMKASLVGASGWWPVRAAAGGNDAPVHFHPGRMMEKGIGIGESAERSRARILDPDGPGEMAGPAGLELLSEMKHLLGGTVSIRSQQTHADEVVKHGQPRQLMSTGQVDQGIGPAEALPETYLWEMWVPSASGLGRNSSDSTITRNLKEVDIASMTAPQPKKKKKDV